MELYIRAPLFDMPICCLVGERSALLNFSYRKLTGGETARFTKSSEYAEAFFSNTSQGLFIWLRNVSDHEVMYHEALHAACEVLKLCGAPVSYQNQETLAYMQGSIVQAILKAHQKETKKQKVKEVT